jgi:hypothetical protein
MLNKQPNRFIAESLAKHSQGRQPKTLNANFGDPILCCFSPVFEPESDANPH